VVNKLQPAAKVAAEAVISTTGSAYNKLKTFVEWKLRRETSSARVKGLKFKKNGITLAAINLIPPEQRRDFHPIPTEQKPAEAMEKCLNKYNFPAEGYEDLCLRVTMGRVIPAASGVNDTDEELISELKKNNQYSQFMHLAARIALATLWKEGENIWLEYQMTDHYAYNYKNWWGNLRPIHNKTLWSLWAKKRPSVAIDPQEVPDEARAVLFAMLHLAYIFAPGCINRFKTDEQAREKIVMLIEENLQGKISPAGASVAAKWAADIACALRGRSSF